MPDLKSSKFIADENFSIKTVKKLSDVGVQIKIPSKGIRNGFLYSLAIEEGLIILTHDADFMDSKRFPPSNSKGMVLIRIHPPKKETIVDALVHFIESTDPEKISGKLVVLTPTGPEIL